SGVDHLDPWDLRSGGGVDVHVVAPAGQAAGQVGHERLRAAALGLPDGRHQRRHDRDLHPASTLKARSRGGLMPMSSKGTFREPRRRTPPATLGKKTPASSTASSTLVNSTDIGPGKLTYR